MIQEYIAQLYQSDLSQNIYNKKIKSYIGVLGLLLHRYPFKMESTVDRMFMFSLFVFLDTFRKFYWTLGNYSLIVGHDNILASLLIQTNVVLSYL